MNFGLTVQMEEVGEKIKLLSPNDLKGIFDKFLDWGISFLVSLVVALLVWFIGKKIIKSLVKFVKKLLTKTDLDIGVVKFLSSLLRYVLYFILIIVVIGILGIDTTSLIAVFGSAGIAVGLALQGSLSNFAGGILILIFKPFKVNDYIIAGANEGKVVTIDMLYTKLLTGDNKTIMIPNGSLSNSSITNVGVQETRRLDIAIGIGYSSDVKKAKELLKNVISNEPNVLKDKDINIFIKELDASCVTLETRAWVESGNYFDTKCELLEKFKEVFDQNGIEIPFNQLDVTIKQQ